MATAEKMRCSDMFRALREMNAGQARVALQDENEEPFGGVMFLRGKEADVEAMISVATAIAKGADVHVEPGEGNPATEDMYPIAKEAGFEFVLTRGEQDGEKVASIVTAGGELTKAVHGATELLEQLWWAREDD